MGIQLSEHFTFKKLLKFVYPSIIMMIFTSIYSVVDGLFVSNFVGKTVLAAINLILPLIMGLSALGFMMGTGGSAIVAKTLGEKKNKKANEYFSLIVYTTIIGGLFFAVLGAILVRPVSIALGATGELLDNCVTVRTNKFYISYAVYAPKCFPKFLCYCRKTKTRTYGNRCRRSYKHGARLCFHRRTRLWFKRSCNSNRMRRMCRRSFTTCIFWQTQQKSA